jgi:accessory gene regulator protein AgrB
MALHLLSLVIYGCYQLIDQLMPFTLVYKVYLLTTTWCLMVDMYLTYLLLRIIDMAVKMINCNEQ